MTVAKITEISASSDISFEDAVKVGVARAAKTLTNIKGAWISEQKVDVVDVFRRSGEVMPAAEDAVAAGAKVLWMQSGVVNEPAAAYAREHGLTVVMDRCLKVDYAALVGRHKRTDRG